MPDPTPTRFAVVSRRSVLRASLGAGIFALVPGLACGNDDTQVFAGAIADPTTTRPADTTTTAPVAADPAASDTTLEATSADVAVDGEMVISFTYTQGVGGKNERPYVAVWIEDAAGDLAATVALWYEQGRRGDRWLDHLSRWYDADLDRIASGAGSDAVTISSATRAPGSYAVAWSGTTSTGVAPAGDYFVCIESVRENGPYSLIRQPLTLSGALDETILPTDGELSAASVRIDA